jgi:NAD(P)-dependent dehydrogenase (short-subunit alcohol dehydrogenase family)
MNTGLTGGRTRVTRGNSGIVEAIAPIVDAGADVAISHRARLEAARSLVQRIQERRGTAIPLQSDLSDPDAQATMFDRVDQA